MKACAYFKHHIWEKRGVDLNRRGELVRLRECACGAQKSIPFESKNR